MSSKTKVVLHEVLSKEFSESVQKQSCHQPVPKAASLSFEDTLCFLFLTIFAQHLQMFTHK